MCIWGIGDKECMFLIKCDIGMNYFIVFFWYECLGEFGGFEVDLFDGICGYLFDCGVCE